MALTGNKRAPVLPDSLDAGAHKNGLQICTHGISAVRGASPVSTPIITEQSYMSGNSAGMRSGMECPLAKGLVLHIT